ncbi:MAG: Ig-like domain-containing protein [Deltaproteobacteria bacterium]|nr:Ig-like domain-containing protein [Deltaproteobacteria bacterium]
MYIKNVLIIILVISITGCQAFTDFDGYSFSSTDSVPDTAKDSSDTLKDSNANTSSDIATDSQTDTNTHADTSTPADTGFSPDTATLFDTDSANIVDTATVSYDTATDDDTNNRVDSETTSGSDFATDSDDSATNTLDSETTEVTTDSDWDTGDSNDRPTDDGEDSDSVYDDTTSTEIIDTETCATGVEFSRSCTADGKVQVIDECGEQISVYECLPNSSTCLDGKCVCENGCDTDSPIITSSSPSDGAVGIRADTTIQISFSEPMNQSSVENAVSISSLLHGGFDFSWNDAGSTLTITPGTSLVYATGTDPETVTARGYTVTLETTAMDLTGNTIETPYSATFHTLRQITQELTPTASAYYYTYQIATGGNVTSCTDDSPFKIGTWTTAQSSGTCHGLVTFETELSSTITQIGSATLQATQDTPDGDFYDIGVVALEQLEFQDLDASITDAAQKINLGTFADSAIRYPSMDITSVFAADFADGHTDFLFRFNGSGGQTNTLAMFRCQLYTLTVQYFLP